MKVVKKFHIPTVVHPIVEGHWVDWSSKVVSTLGVFES